jgi:hypothetical protein
VQRPEIPGLVMNHAAIFPTHFKGIGIRLGAKTKAECMALLTYLKDKDPKRRLIKEQ